MAKALIWAVVTTAADVARTAAATVVVAATSHTEVDTRVVVATVVAMEDTVALPLVAVVATAAVDLLSVTRRTRCSSVA